VRLTGINRYPVKSCRGQSLTEALVDPWGLRGDRRWMLVDDAGMVVTARENPQLVLVGVEPVEAGLRLTSPGRPELEVNEPTGGEQSPVQVWKSALTAAPAAAPANAWFSDLLGFSVRLVYLDDPTRRPVNPLFGGPADVVSFADGYPLLLTTEESLATLNELIAVGPRAEEAPLPMTRFRPNVVVSGAPAWAEDGWTSITIGAVHFRAVKACDRCVFTTIDPDTAIKGREPLVTLARHRHWDGKIWFGMNLIPDVAVGTDARIAVGDAVSVS